MVNNSLAGTTDSAKLRSWNFPKEFSFQRALRIVPVSYIVNEIRIDIKGWFENKSDNNRIADKYRTTLCKMMPLECFDIRHEITLNKTVHRVSSERV